MKTVFVGLSGGVDSAVSAYLLKKRGYRVVGVFIKVWEPDFLPCTSGTDRLDAMRIAAHLGIPFKTYDLAKEYKREVVDVFIAEYRAGRTPNPDVLCNRSIKFGAFWEKARADGADFVATGHYARNIDGKLFRGVDPTKDQTYFLWMLTQDDLTHTLFPVGRLTKSTVRGIAAEAGLPNAAKRDSQGLCFLGQVDMKEFLMRMLPAAADDPRLYTIGERVSGKYVVAKKDGQLVLGDQTAGEGVRALTLIQVKWIRETPDPRLIIEAEVRYHGEKHPAQLQEEGGKWKVVLKQPVLAAPGQSLVLYDSATGECIGGGIIASDGSHRKRGRLGRGV